LIYFVDMSISRAGILPASTENSYAVYRKKFAEFNNSVPFEPLMALPRDIYVDSKVAAFVAALGSENDWKVGNFQFLFFLMN
jgi:hypothetical protein